MEFKKLTLEDKKLFMDFADTYAPPNTYYSFAIRYMWGDTYVSYYPGGMGLFSVYDGQEKYLFPIGKCDIKSVIEDYIADASLRGIEFCMDGLSENDCKKIEDAFPGKFTFEADNNFSDYVYDINDLADLKGRKYHKKKNHVNKFLAEHPDYQVVPITPDNIEMARNLCDEWFKSHQDRCENKDCVGYNDDEFCNEKIALSRAYDNYEALNMEGAILIAEGQPLAVTMASRLSDDTYDVHFEKSIDDGGTSYAMINYEFAKMLRSSHPELKYLNREEDMGLAGLRQAKLSYHPHHLEPKYRCTKNVSVGVSVGTCTTHTKIEELMALWMENFGDTKSEVQNFFETAYSPDRLHTIETGGHIVSALYWLDYTIGTEKIAYIYAASTKKEYRNQGFFKKLIEETHQILKGKGYGGVMLVPENAELFSLYEKLGYTTTIYKPSYDEKPIVYKCGPDKSGTVKDATDQDGLVPISVNEYENLREKYLTSGTAFPENYVLKYIETLALFYKNETEIISVSKNEPKKILERITKDNFACDKSLCDKPHGMFLPLKEGCPVPNYIGLDLG